LDSVKARDHSEDLDVDGKIILRDLRKVELENVDLIISGPVAAPVNMIANLLDP
jgi:hypothetical protein